MDFGELYRESLRRVEDHRAAVLDRADGRVVFLACDEDVAGARLTGEIARRAENDGWEVWRLAVQNGRLQRSPRPTASAIEVGTQAVKVVGALAQFVDPIVSAALASSGEVASLATMLWGGPADGPLDEPIALNRLETLLVRTSMIKPLLVVVEDGDQILESQLLWSFFLGLRAPRLVKSARIMFVVTIALRESHPVPSVRDVLMSVPNECAFREDVRRPEVADVAGALSIANDDIAASLFACAVGKAEVAEFLWRQWEAAGYVFRSELGWQRDATFRAEAVTSIEYWVDLCSPGCCRTPTCCAKPSTC